MIFLSSSLKNRRSSGCACREPRQGSNLKPMLHAPEILRIHLGGPIPKVLGTGRMIVHSEAEPCEMPPSDRPLGSLKLVLEGEEVYTAGQARFRLRPGQLLWVPAGFRTSTEIPLNRGAEGICLYTPAGSHAPDEPYLFSLPKTLESPLYRLATSLRKGGDTATALALGAVEAGWERFTQRQRQAEASLTLQRGAAVRALALRLARAEARIATEYAEALSVDLLAEEACLSPFAFARRFREAFGKTPMALTTEYRLEAARALMLTHPELPLSGIAVAVGYADLPTFSKAFRREAGLPPNQWRGQMSKEGQALR